ncbi:hypothetical protein GPECTOR_17g800 [Gonium pectorale]|uniref:EF-hand domain-containing protein n=1 Tax=Gonium pectorale TaxID=33097 RepID=A0A150GK58_GONPE|nr:hypothetical protein GPECTOR_17g800 [Gonium pectorale]|eukprot:KXZ50164.1 hypothetical protein GPECTOR_17g800 [Gonium pectorale]
MPVVATPAERRSAERREQPIVAQGGSTRPFLALSSSALYSDAPMPNAFTAPAQPRPATQAAGQQSSEAEAPSSLPTADGVVAGAAGAPAPDGKGKGTEAENDGNAGKDKERAVPSADQVVENLENLDVLALFEEEEEDEDAEDDDLEPPPWHRRPAVLWFLGSVGVGLLLLLVGVILQNVFEKGSSDAFRWFYFFSGTPIMYYALSYAVQRAFTVIEWWFFRESLLYLHNVQRSAVWLLFFLMQLPWFCTMFRWAWCTSTSRFPKRCQQPAYLQATSILWNCLLCVMLFCLANLLKAVLAKLLTTHFYRTAHFNKLKKALEKEYVLQPLYGNAEDPDQSTDVSALPPAQAAAAIPCSPTGSEADAAAGSPAAAHVMPPGRAVGGTALSVPAGGAAPAASGGRVGPSPPIGHGLLGGAGGAEVAPAAAAEQAAHACAAVEAADGAAAHGPAQLVRRQDSRASRMSKVSALKPANKAAAAGAAKKGDEAVSQAMLDVVPPGNALTAQKGLRHMTEAELEVVRTAIVIKTQTALISKYAEKSAEEMEKEMGRVRRFAKALYFNVLPPHAGRSHLLAEDFFNTAERARATRRRQAEAAAKKAFAIFDADGDGEVSRQEVREAVVNIYKERRNMARSLRDTETIVQSLEFGIGVVIHFIFAAVYLLIWGVDLLTGFSTFSATVLALTFVFGNSVK